jgi:hypothetical protein
LAATSGRHDRRSLWGVLSRERPPAVTNP